MVDSFNIEDLDQVNILGEKLNPNFKKLFHVDKLNKTEKIYVYKKNDQILGFIHINNNLDEVELLNIYVLDEYQHQGIGSLLMDYMITSLPYNTKRIILEVDETNKEAINFYYLFNFEVINIRKNYYQNNNGLVMERIFK